jgi:hypothetical protein
MSTLRDATPLNIGEAAIVLHGISRRFSAHLCFLSHIAVEFRLPLTNATDSHASSSESLKRPLPGRAALNPDRRLAPWTATSRGRTSIEHEVPRRSASRPPGIQAH